MMMAPVMLSHKMAVLSWLFRRFWRFPLAIGSLGFRVQIRKEYHENEDKSDEVVSWLANCLNWNWKIPTAKSIENDARSPELLYVDIRPKIMTSPTLKAAATTAVISTINETLKVSSKSTPRIIWINFHEEKGHESLSEAILDKLKSHNYTSLPTPTSELVFLRKAPQ